MTVKFDDAKTAEAVKNKRLYDKINIAFITFIVCFAVIAAVCTNYLGELGAWFFGVLGIILIGFVLYEILFVSKARKDVRREVARVIADGFTADGSVLSGGGNIAFTVDYGDGTLTVKRQNFSGEIAITPADFKDGARLALRGGELNFDLSGLKALPAVYSDAGVYIWEFLQAYYTVHFEKGKYTRVHVIDNTAKRPAEMAIIEGGELVGNSEKNYFIKAGIIK